jgi:HPt (histidine-containing phosphotransfer) domain-containing protein
MAHTLGGSAGMFGFGQLAFVSKRFEYAVQRNASDCRSRAAELVVSVEQARAEILARLAAIEAKAARKAALDPGGAETLGADIMRPVRHRGVVNTT